MSTNFCAGVLVGAIGGLVYSLRDTKKRREEQAIGKLQGVLIDTVRLAQKQATQQFNDTATKLRRTANKAFDSAVVETQKELQDRLALIEETIRTTTEETAERIKQLQERLNRADSLLRAVNKMTT